MNIDLYLILGIILVFVILAYLYVKKTKESLVEYAKSMLETPYVYRKSQKNFNRLGIALMDGKFFSFLPNGEKNKHIFYHVKYSILYEKILKKYPASWKINKKLYKKIEKSEKKILADLGKYFPKMKLTKTGKKFISPRVLPINQEGTDKRISSIKEISKNYYKIISAKVDHSVDMALKLERIIKRKNS